MLLNDSASGNDLQCTIQQHSNALVVVWQSPSFFRQAPLIEALRSTQLSYPLGCRVELILITYDSWLGGTEWTATCLNHLFIPPAISSLLSCTGEHDKRNRSHLVVSVDSAVQRGRLLAGNGLKWRFGVRKLTCDDDGESSGIRVNQISAEARTKKSHQAMESTQPCSITNCVTRNISLADQPVGPFVNLVTVDRVSSRDDSRPSLRTYIWTQRLDTSPPRLEDG